MHRLVVMTLILAGCPQTNDSDSDVDTTDGTDVGTDMGTDMGTDTGNVSVLNYDSPCGSTEAVGPGSGEAGYWSAAKLDTGAANIDRVVILMDDEPSICDNTGSHTVSVWAGTGSTPDASPPGSTISGTVSNGQIEVSVDVDVAAGESLFVAIQHNGDPNSSVSCIQACATGDGSTSYWSGAASAPFSWQSYSAISVSSDFAVEAYGTAL